MFTQHSCPAFPESCLLLVIISFLPKTFSFACLLTWMDFYSPTGMILVYVMIQLRLPVSLPVSALIIHVFCVLLCEISYKTLPRVHVKDTLVAVRTVNLAGFRSVFLHNLVLNQGRERTSCCQGKMNRCHPECVCFIWRKKRVRYFLIMHPKLGLVENNWELIRSVAL